MVKLTSMKVILLIVLLIILHFIFLAKIQTKSLNLPHSFSSGPAVALVFPAKETEDKRRGQCGELRCVIRSDTAASHM